MVWHSGLRINLLQLARVVAEACVQSQAQCTGLEYAVLLHRLQLRLGFNLWLRDFHMPWVQPLKKERKKKPEVELLEANSSFPIQKFGKKYL